MEESFAENRKHQQDVKSVRSVNTVKNDIPKFKRGKRIIYQN